MLLSSARLHQLSCPCRHQPAADLIVAHDLKQLAMKHAELLAQDPAGDQQRFDDRGQVRMVRDQLTNSSLELDRAYHANLEAEIAQRAPQIILDVERLGLQKLATGQQAPSGATAKSHIAR